MTLSQSAVAWYRNWYIIVLISYPYRRRCASILGNWPLWVRLLARSDLNPFLTLVPYKFREHNIIPERIFIHFAILLFEEQS